MTKIFRWQGIILFVVLTALLAGLWIVFADRTAERSIEKAGTMIVGARVDLDKADVKLSPLGITLTRLQVTNPERPMTNAVEVGRIAFQMDSLNALRRKVIIEEMSVEDVRLNTPRKTSGATSAAEKAERSEALDALTGLPSFVAANVKDIFEKEKDDLASLRLITASGDEAAALHKKWEGKVKEIRQAADVEKYRKRIAELKGTDRGTVAGILGGSKELLALQKEVRADIETVTSAKREFEKDFASAKQAAADVPASIGSDARRLLEKYSLSPEGLSNISRALFGGEIAAKVRTFLKWRDRLSPLIDRIKQQRKGKDVVKPIRAEGMNVRFREDNPLPDFLVRLAHISVNLPAGAFDGRLENLTPDQDVLGMPVTFALSGENLKGLRAASIEGTLNRVNPGKIKDSFTLKIRGYQAKEMPVSRNEALPIRLKEGLVNLDVGATFEGEGISVKLGAGLSSIQFAVEEKEAAGEIIRALRAALMGVREFDLTAEVTGTPEDFAIKVRSGLDNVLKSAVDSLVRSQTERAEKELRGLIDSHLAVPLKNLNASLGGMDLMGGELEALRKQLEGLLSLRK